jgi:hypothetical protein
MGGEEVTGDQFTILLITLTVLSIFVVGSLGTAIWGATSEIIKAIEGRKK